MGLGYGVTTPAGSDILARTAPARHRGVLFSIKQAGMPLGGVLAGLSVPWLFGLMGWREALAVGALPVVLAVLAVQPFRRGIDGGRDPAARLTLSAFLSVGNTLKPFLVLKTSPALVRLSLAGIALATAQGCLFSFQATFLNVELGLSLAAAGTLFAITQSIGVFGRVCAGFLADRLGSGARALALLSLASAVMMLATAAVGPGWGWTALLAWSAVAGVAVGTWNGVFLSEIAALSPPGQVAEATAGTTFLCFIGYVVGPFAFSLIVAWTGVYWPAYVASAVPALLSAVMLIRAGLVGR
jgi:MFS family permease